MEMKIIQFNFNNGGGGASICLEGPSPKSNLDPLQYFAFLVAFHTRPSHDVADNLDQMSTPIPDYEDRWLTVTFGPIQYINIPRDHPQPDADSYRPRAAKLLAAMTLFARPAELTAPIPHVMK